MDGSFSELPRRSTRRVLLESRRDFESQSPPFHHRSGPSVDRKRKLSSESGGMGREREGNGGREGEGERRGGRDMTYNKRSSNTLYTTQHKRPRIHSNSGTVSMDTIVPLRRSKREKRLIFSNLNQQEIYHHMIDGPHYSVVDFSDDELDPYEKILSPVRRRQRRTHPSSPHSSPRSQSHPSPGHCVASTKMKLRSSALEHSIKAETSEDAEKEGVGVSEDVKTCSGGAGGDDGSVGRVEEEEGEEVREGDDTEEHEEEDKEMDDEEEEEEGGRSYYLRKRRPVVYQYQPIIQVVEEDTPPKKRRPRGRRASGSDSAYFRKSGTSRAYQSKGQNSSSAIVSRRIHRLPHAAHDSSSTSSSGSDTDEARFCRRKSRSMKKSRLQCLPMNFDPSDLTQPVIRDRQRIGASLADIDPMNINREVTFESIGGLKQHIRSLKEMILFPLLYPEVFDRFKIQPPRGVLFYGPPGCGKTLVARALANECSKGGKTVAFFMRKGADCLSKWVGESERQLRLLFDQAYQLRPSIIFFDEIDGLAPVRSTRQDQIHSSIVSTLLALMDGLDSRGEVVVIGATNRIDAIDPALRRPGRFDREFLFPLPSREDRACIISIHTQQWSPPLKPSFISQLADQTVGYCGADLRSLCTEAALSALRRTYPQIYNSQDKLVLDVTTINVSSTDFHMSLDRIVPTARRSESSPARALRAEVVPLLLRAYGDVLNVLEVVFNPAWKAVEKARQGYRVAVAMETQRDKELEQHILSLHNNDDHHDNRTNSFIVSQVSQTSQTTTSIRTSSLHSLSHSESRTSHFVTGQQLMSQKSLSDVFESSQPDSSEDRVYYEMNDVVNEVGGVESITMETDNTDMEIVETDDGCRGDGNQATDIQKAVSLFNTALSSSHPHILPSVHRPRLLLCGPAGGGQSSHLGPALLHALEEIPVKVLDLSVLFGVSSCTPEESLTQLFKEAKRVSSSVLYLPRLNSWWSVTTETFQATFTSCLLSLPPSTSLIVIATAECPWNDLPSSLKRLFDMSCETFSVTSSLREERKRFFADVLLFKPLQPSPNIPPTNGATQHKTLPIAPPPKPRQLAPIELQKMDKQRGSVLRELRMFLREATNKLLAERKFKEFSRSVDPEEVPDYYDIIKEPMDLGTIMKKIDEHKYTLPKQWLEDVDRINKNALEYNPARDPESRLLLHRAVALQDMAHSILEHELSEDFEQQCEDIEDTYRKLGRSSSVHSSPFKLTTSKPQSHPPRTPSPTHSSAHSSQQGSFYERRRSLRQKGLQPEEKGFDYYCTSRTPRKEGSRGLNDHKSHDHQADRHYDDEKEDMDDVQEEEDEGEGEGGEGHKIDDILIEDVPNEREMEGRRGEERGEREGGEDEGAIESGWDDDEEMNTPTQDIISSVRSSRRPSSKSKRRKRRHLLESSKQYQNIEVVSCSGTENGISKREKQRMRMGHRTKRDVLIDEDHDMVATRNCLHDDRFNDPKHDFKSDSAIIKIPQLPRRLSSAKQRLFDRSNSTGSPSTHHRSNEDITMATSENENTRNGAEDSDRESQSSSQKVLQNTERDTGRCIITHVQNSASDRSSPAVRVEEDEEEIDSRALRRGNGRSNSFATGHTSRYASDGIDGNGITTSSSSTLLRKSKSKATPTITDVDDNGIVMTTTKKGKSVARTLSADVKSSKRLNTEENGADGDDCVLVKLKNKNVGRNLCNGQVAMATSECWLGRDGLAMRAGSSGGGDHDMEEERETRAMDTCHWEETNDNVEQISNLNSTQCNNGSANSTRRNSRNGTSLNSKSTQDAVATSSSSLPGNPIAASNNINPMQPQTRTNAVQIDRKRLLTLFERVVDETVTCSLETMEKMLSTFNHLVFRYRMREDRRQLNVDLELAADLFL